MVARLILTVEVEQDIAEVYAWYEGRRRGLGEEFLGSLEASLEAIRRYPELLAPVHENYRRALVRRFPYCIFYEFEKKPKPFSTLSMRRVIRRSGSSGFHELLRLLRRTWATSHADHTCVVESEVDAIGFCFGPEIEPTTGRQAGISLGERNSLFTVVSENGQPRECPVRCVLKLDSLYVSARDQKGFRSAFRICPTGASRILD